MKKRVLSIFFIFMIISLTLLVSASSNTSINLQVETEVLNSVIVSELNNPATFNFQIENLGPTDNFQIYSLIGVDITPRGTFQIVSGETKNIEVKVYAMDNVRNNPGILNFVYKIQGRDSGIQDGVLTINIMKMQDALEIGAYSINPKSTYATIFMNNKVNEAFDMKVDFTSAFFESSQDFHIEPLQVKYFNITLDRERMKVLIAGQYIMTADIFISGEKYKITGKIKFAEQEGLTTKETSSGFFFRRNVIEKINDGNIPALAIVNVRKNILSRLFTTFNIEPEQVTRKGFYVYYIFQKEIKPSESFVIKVTTSWIYPLILLLLVLIIAFLIYVYTMTDLILKKKINFVKTKSGEFALRVIVTAKARRYVEKIEISDKLPGLVKIYEKFSGTPPDKLDHQRRRIVWNIGEMNEGEQRIFSYIIYSKISVVGKFELPPALAVFEREGKVKQTFSNRTFFMNEPMKKSEE